MSKPIHLVVGANGNVGKVLALDLLARGERVRVLVRTGASSAEWQKHGADVVVGDVTNRDSLVRAMEGVASAFLMNPPNLAAPDLFAQCKLIAENYNEALRRAKVAKAVVLSSIGGELEEGSGVVRTARILEAALDGACPAVAFVRASTFFENLRRSLPLVLQTSVLSCFHAPELAVESIATRDIGTLAAELMVKQWSGKRIIELSAAEPCSPAQTASILSELLGKPIQTAFVPYEQQPFVMQHMGVPELTAKAWVEMNKGIDSRHIKFSGKHETVHGKTTAREAIAAIVASK